jgi:ankyrin repeat protein
MGYTAVHWAAAQGHRYVLELLLHTGLVPSARATLVAAQTTAGHTPAVLAAREGHVTIVQLLLRLGGGANDHDHAPAALLLSAPAPVPVPAPVPMPAPASAQGMIRSLVRVT